MSELTIGEKQLILQALNLMFRSGAVRGSIDDIETIISVARSIEAKFNVVLAENVPELGEIKKPSGDG